MARPRSKSKLTSDELSYLGGLFDMSYGLGGANPNTAVRISGKNDDPYLLWLVERYGGAIKVVPTNKAKEVFGWYLPLSDRMNYFRQLTSTPEPYIRSLDIYAHDAFVQKLQKAINSGYE